MSHRVVGFDLARAYAILGMFIVNFNTVFGSHKANTGLGWFLNLFNGNSSTLFVILAGMGVSLMTNRPHYTPTEQAVLRQRVMRRSWFLFVAGLLLYTWWPADILHFYGGYMHIAALLLFVPKRNYLYLALTSITLFHILLIIIPFETGWNFDTLTYADFWTPAGFVRNTFYNGWNPIFPWLAYFMLGMWLGRLNWQQPRTRWWVLGMGAGVLVVVEGIQALAATGVFGPDLTFYLTADYLPPFLPFMLATASFALILIVVCLTLGDRFAHTRVVRALSLMGQMTLTHYVVHLTLGFLLFVGLTGHSYTGTITAQPPEPPALVLGFALGFYGLSALFSLFWSRRFVHGPLETLMRKIAG
ncbi:DUF418 domain-containing protein [Spirosoma montaniterrae]|uniref:DUF418 domain-containing protein n=1 Tax=Spirosoma montaniterrae TaxID=1178516 RepID=A0A1P9X4T0_9BACT|nr:DUF418 domain-containing protein [Spirosoma montaniterrae]AQG82646.1 hypothetical protein AWR27_22190 [Spirosoma montaniterrae]